MAWGVGCRTRARSVRQRVRAEGAHRASSQGPRTCGCGRSAIATGDSRMSTPPSTRSASRWWVRLKQETRGRCGSARSSHQADREEIDRCKAAYEANKEKAAKERAAHAATAEQAPPSPEMMRRVKAITTAAVEQQRAVVAAPSPAVPAAAKAPEPPAAVEDAESSSWPGPVGTVVILAVVVGFGVNLVRRKQAQSA